jgi:hypothetical protein
MLRARILVVTVNNILIFMSRNSNLGLKQPMFCGKKLKINPSANRAAVQSNFSGKSYKKQRGHEDLEDDTLSVWWSTAPNP